MLCFPLEENHYRILRSNLVLLTHNWRRFSLNFTSTVIILYNIWAISLIFSGFKIQRFTWHRQICYIRIILFLLQDSWGIAVLPDFPSRENLLLLQSTPAGCTSLLKTTLEEVGPSQKDMQLISRQDLKPWTICPICVNTNIYFKAQSNFG